MPLYLDIHELRGATSEDLAKAHSGDVEAERKYGVNYRKYWFNESCGKAFCLVEAPNAEAATRVHREAHGHVADKIIEVDPDLADGFLGGGEVNSAGAVLLPGGAANALDPAIRTVLFTDIVDSTAMTQRLGDDKAMEMLRIHDTTVRDALDANSGREVKHTGDGIMASFLSAACAVRCALEIQRELARRERSDLPVKVRIGGAAGEPVDHANDIFGSTVQLAARLCAHAVPEQIVVSNVVAELCIGKGLTFRPLGEVSLKGVEKPIQVHAAEDPSA
ncbi:MAG: nickel-binding protein [Chthoniobacterales bacterium]